MDTSVSQVETFERCPSWWAYGHVHGIWKQSSRDADEGIQVHEYLASYSSIGQKPDKTPLGQLAKAVIDLDLIPSCSDGPMVEASASVQYAGFHFKLKPDAMWLAPLGVMLNDYKSVKSFGYMKKTAQLRTDLQAAVYTLHGLATFPGYSDVNLQWIYMKRPTPGRPMKPDDIRVTEAVMDDDDARTVLRSKRQTLDNMANIRSKRLPMSDIVRVPSACRAMGGCPYRGECYPDMYGKETGQLLEHAK